MYLLYAKKHAVVFQSPSRVWLSVTPWTVAHQASLSLTISQSVPKFVLIVSVMLSSHLILWCPLLLLPSIFPSIRDFSNELSVHIGWPKYWSFSFSIVLPMTIQGWFQDWLIWSPCCPRDSQKSFPAPQFKGTDFLAVHLLYNSALTTIYDHWEDHTLDYMDLCWQSNVSVSQYTT